MTALWANAEDAATAERPISALAELADSTIERLLREDVVANPAEAELLTWRAVVGGVPGGSRPSEDVLDRLFLATPCAGTHVLSGARDAASALLANESDPADVIGQAFETQYGARHEALSSKNHRRDQGVFFTPKELVRLTVELALEPRLRSAQSAGDLLDLRICDPAMGAGAFLLCALDVVAERVLELSENTPTILEAKAQVARRCLHGADADPVAVALSRALLTVAAGGLIDDEVLMARIRWGDSLLSDPDSAELLDLREPAVGVGPTPPVRWWSDFSDVFSRGGEAAGFDVIIGNPPWGAVKPAFKEYHGHHDATVRNGQGAALRQQVYDSAPDDVWLGWVDYKGRVRAYAQALRSMPAYRHQGVGDTELYRYFLERAHQLVSPTGRIAMVVPAAIERAEGAAPLRQLFLGSGTFEHIMDFENRRRIFPIHSMFRFAFVVWQRGASRGVENAAFGLQTVEAAESAVRSRPPVSMPLSFLRSSGDRLSVPELRSVRDRDLFSKLHEAAPILGDTQGGPWSVSYVRELDMTNDSSLFIASSPALSGTSCSEEARELLPLFEGRLVHQFDAAAKRYLGGDGRMARWEPLPFDQKVVQPHFFVDANDPKVQARWPRRARAGFCDVTGHANERTVLAALIPANAVCGNKVPTCRFDRDEPSLDLLWLALVNSFVVDWYMRRRIGTSLNFFLWSQVPIPRLEPSVPAAQELITLAEELSRPPWEPGAPVLSERARLRAAIDAAVVDLYGLEVDDFAWLLQDFPLLDRGQSGGRDSRSVPRRAESTITRDTALLALARRRGMDDLDLRDLPCANAGKGPTSCAERAALAEAAGEVAYVPSELAAQGTRQPTL